MGKIRVIAAVGAVGSEINDFMACLEQVRNELGFVFQASVVAANAEL